MGKVKHELWLFSKAQVTAQLATLTDFGVSILLYELFGMWYVAASFIGAVSGGIVNCLLNYRWVFGSDGQKKRYVALKYLLVWTGSILLNTGGTYALTELSGHYFVIAKAIVSVAVALLWNYQMQRFFVYRNKHITK
jgi:putative flippase GtrA